MTATTILSIIIFFFIFQQYITGFHKINTIPISHFSLGGTADIASVTIETIQDAVLKVDDVRLVQKMEYPVHGITREVSGYHFGQFWDEQDNCPYDDKYHTGVDYRTLYPRNIYSATRGFVKKTGSQGGAGEYIIIQHENELTTTYLHTDPLNGLIVEDEVGQGELIGHTDNIPSPHLHFNLRLKDYDGNTQNGALPLQKTSSCNYPGFPSGFLNTEFMW